MFKRVLVITSILSFLALIVLVPANMTQAAGNLQGTPLPTIVVPTAVVPSDPTAQPVVPVTGNPSFSGLVILGLIIVVALAIIVGGVALMSRRSDHTHTPPGE
jgi:hypothetical protein